MKNFIEFFGFYLSDFEFVFQLIIASILGGLIGYKRERTHHPERLRTYILVALSSAAFVIIGRKITSDTDIDRIIQGIITGIGFIVEGAILKEGMSCKRHYHSSIIMGCFYDRYFRS